jgi:hypothetical protein
LCCKGARAATVYVCTAAALLMMSESMSVCAGERGQGGGWAHAGLEKTLVTAEESDFGTAP